MDKVMIMIMGYSQSDIHFLRMHVDQLEGVGSVLLPAAARFNAARLRVHGDHTMIMA